MVGILVIIVTQAQELLYMLDTHQNRTLLDGLKLAESAQMELALTMCPRYSIDYCKKAHFYSLAKNVCHKGARGLCGDGQDGC